jgi:hypothetical protein
MASQSAESRPLIFKLILQPPDFGPARGEDVIDLRLEHSGENVPAKTPDDGPPGPCARPYVIEIITRCSGVNVQMRGEPLIPVRIGILATQEAGQATRQNLII